MFGELGWGREGGRTTRMCTQHIADGFCVGAYAVDAGDEVAAVALEEDAVFGPVVVLVVFVPCALE